MTRVHRVAVAVLLAACSKGETRSNSAAGGASQVAQVPAQVQAPQTRATGPGDLTKPLDQYTGDELFALVNSLQYVGGVTRDRRCRDLPGCGGGNPTVRTRLNLEAIAGEDSVGGGNIGPFGTIVVRARNLGTAPDAMYGMRPGNRFQYFLIVFADTGNTARFQLEQLEVVGNNRTHTTLTAGRLIGCNHPFVRGARADFRTCAQPPLIRPASFVQGGEDPPMWFACQQGCCVASG